MTTTSRPSRRVELYVRDETRGLADRRQQVLRRETDALETSGVVETVDEFAWPRTLRLADRTQHRATRDAFNAFSAWARDADVTLTPAFGTRMRYARDTGQREMEVVLPVMCLAVYEDGELEAVYPHTDGDQCLTVFDGLDRLRARDTNQQERDRKPVPAE